MSAEPPASRTSRTPVESLAVPRAPWWDPRRSLAARFFWLLLPLALVPISIYWFVADRELASSEREVAGMLLTHETELERVRLRSAAEARVQEIETLAKVGAEGAVERDFGREVGREAGGDVEILLQGSGRPPLVRPPNGLSPDELASIEGLVARGAMGDHELSSGGETHLITGLRLSGPPWTYVRKASLTPVRSQVEAINDDGLAAPVT